MKLFKQLRRERALARFSIMTYEDWLRSKYGGAQGGGSRYYKDRFTGDSMEEEDCIVRFGVSEEPEDLQAYNMYVVRKEVELNSLKKGANA